MADKAKTAVRKSTRQKALARLAGEFPKEYKALRTRVREERPELSRPGATYLAREMLRELQPIRYYAILAEERGLSARDFNELAAIVVDLYGDGIKPRRGRRSSK